MDPVVKKTKFHSYHLPSYLKAISTNIKSENEHRCSVDVKKVIGTRLQNFQVTFPFSSCASVCKLKIIFLVFIPLSITCFPC